MGGALVLNKHFEGEFRDLYVPGMWYYNPRTGQCEETAGRVYKYSGANMRHVVKTRLSNFLIEQHLLGKRGLRALNATFDEEGLALFTHIYVLTPEVEGMQNVLLEKGYRFYADNELMRKEIR